MFGGAFLFYENVSIQFFFPPSRCGYRPEAAITDQSEDGFDSGNSLDWPISPFSADPGSCGH